MELITLLISTHEPPSNRRELLRWGCLRAEGAPPHASERLRPLAELGVPALASGSFLVFARVTPKPRSQSQAMIGASMIRVGVWSIVM